SPVLMPHRLNRNTYAQAPLLLWQPARAEILYNHQVMRDFYVGWELSTYQRTRSIRGLAWNISKRVGGLWLFFLGPILSIPLIMLPWIAGDKRIRFLLVVCAVMAVGLLLEVWTTPHYAAPMTGVILAILL